MNQDFCSKTDIEGKHSAGGFVRLNHPTQYKIGGGSRVSSISISDNSAQFNMGENTDYTQYFNYEKNSGTMDQNGNPIKISSGVAAYEPMLGGDENPFHMPVNFFTTYQEKFLIPDDRFFMEEPIGESFFPAPIVGYSRVTVTQKFPNLVKRHATGNTVHEFYTANDYPVRTAETNLDAQRRQSPLVFRITKINKKDFVTASQGYAIHINDMHGKPKAKWAFAEGQTEAISGVQYFYKTAEDNNKKLDNRITVVYPDGSHKESIVGVDIDFVMDMRQQKTDAESKGLNVNLESFLVLFPGIVPLVFPGFSKENTRFRSSVATKVVNSYGILDKVIVHDLKSSLTTQNLAYDSESGEVLLTSVHNGFDDPVYSFNYPAHWAYDGMGQAYKNSQFTAKLTLDGEGKSSLSPYIYNLFSEGDEVITNDPLQKQYKYWVTEKSGTSITIMGGNPETGAITFLKGSNILVKIIRSGRRNLQSTSIGTLVSLQNPLTHLTNLTATQKILQAESREFSNVWDDECDCAFEKLSTSDRRNAYFEASKGIWRLRRTYTYLTLRDELTVNGTRKDGAFKLFNAFWNKGTTNWDKKEDGWTWVNEVTSYDRQSGMETENKDKLGRYSGALSGFNATLPTAIAPNTKKTETLFDHFEDYDRLNCVNLEKAFNKNDPMFYINKTKSHSGRNSYKVSPNDVVEMEVNK